MSLTDRKSFLLRENALAKAIGFALLLVPVLFVTLKVLQYGIGVAIPWNPFDAIYDTPDHTALTYSFDALILFGPLLALAMLVPPLVKIAWGGNNGAFAITLTLFPGSRATIGLIAVSVATIAILGAYLLIENLPCILGQQTQC